jgi:hypothetical protein
VLNLNYPEESPVPTIVAGDFTSLVPVIGKKFSPAKVSDKILGTVGSELVRTAANTVLLPFRTAEGKAGYYARAFDTMNQRRVIPEMIDKFGYERARSGPTHYFADVALLGLDHVLARNVKILETRTVGDPDMSNHKAVIVTFEMPELGPRQ